ncbi:MAG: hypothetical protein LUO89_15400 [Methanothrix sp.]|nr:hypothetical protein [Methanothrix sp.]
MKFAEMSGYMALIALAAVCLFVAPAMSMPMENSGREGHCGMFPQMSNLTEEQMGNMTLGELKEIQKQAWNNTTACLAKEPGQNCSRWGKNANESLGMNGMGMEKMGMGDNQMRGGPMRDEPMNDGLMNERMNERSGHMNAMHGQNDNVSQCDKASQGMAKATPIMLLMDDLTVEKLGNMTINQIKDLSEKKMQELDNMTLNQIKQLQEKNVQDKDNLTLSQLKEENKNMRQIARILGWAGSGCHLRNW